MSGGLLDRALNVGGKIIDGNIQAGGALLRGGSRAVGGLLEEVGLDGAAQSVRGWGDDAADAAGRGVGEAKLGQSDDVRHLLHGDPKRIGEVAAHLKRFHDAFEKTGTALARLDHEHWTGEAAEAFRATFTPQPKGWLSAADACGKAAAALENYAHTVTWARGQAEEAVRMWKAAQKKLDAAVEQWRKDAVTYNLRAKAYNAMPADQRPATPPARPEDFTNPVEGEFQAAQEKLDAARRQRDSAAAIATQAVGAAMEAAPAKPSAAQRLKADVADGLDAAPVALLHFGGGVVEAGSDMVKLGRSLSPYDPYNISHPHKYIETLNTTLAGLVTAGDHPVELVKGIVGSGWGSDPAEASGKLAGNILLGAGGGGGGSAAKAAAGAAAKNAAKEVGEQAAKEAADKAAKEAFEKIGTRAGGEVPLPNGAAALPESWRIKPPEGAGAGAGGYRPAAEPVAPHPPSRTPSPFDDLETGYDFQAEAVREAKRLELQAAERELAAKARDFDGIDAKEYGAKTWNDVAEKLPAEQKDAVSKYTWGSDGEINRALRGTGPATAEAGRLIPELDKALQARPIPENVVVHRGTDLGYLGLDDPMSMTGKSFVEKGFMSTSLGELPAIYQGKQGILHLTVPAGTPGMWVEKAGQVGAGESELLLRRGLTWRVDRVVQIGDQYHVFGEVVG